MSKRNLRALMFLIAQNHGRILKTLMLQILTLVNLTPALGQLLDRERGVSARRNEMPPWHEIGDGRVAFSNSTCPLAPLEERQLCRKTIRLTPADPRSIEGFQPSRTRRKGASSDDCRTSTPFRGRYHAPGRCCSSRLSRPRRLPGYATSARRRDVPAAPRNAASVNTKRSPASTGRINLAGSPAFRGRPT